jgi:hypothetical protein
MIQYGRGTAFFVAATAALALALGPESAWAQPPVAKPQPPPKPATETAKTPAAPGTATAPAAAQPSTTPGTSPATATGGARPVPPPPATGAAAAPPPAAAKTVAADALTAEQAPSEALLGAPVLPNAQFLGSYDAGGAGQRFYLYGSVQRFPEVVAYYRTVLKQKGELVFDVPATHMFEVGKFREDQVAFPPGVTVKDYTTGGSPGLPNPKFGAAPAAFPTVIQIVPPAVVPAGRPR